MVDPLPLGGYVAHQVTKAPSAGELGNRHGKKLAPATEGAEFCPLWYLLANLSKSCLGKDEAIWLRTVLQCAMAWSSLYCLFFRKFIITQEALRAFIWIS